VLELAILGLLKERSMHGYQLSKQLTETLGGFWRVSYGSLYPTLRRLEKQGAVERLCSRNFSRRPGSKSPGRTTASAFASRSSST
jgi:DNA-binding PadR family transcriptional regulator